MRRRFVIDFHVERSSGRRFKNYIGELGLVEFWNDPHNERALPYFLHTLYEDDRRLDELRDLLRREGIQWSEREEHIYTDAELREFPLLTIGVDRKPIQGGGPEYGTAYDLSNACPRCGTGAVQTSPLMIALAGLPKKGLICSTCLGEILVAERAKMELQNANGSGLELRQTRFYRNNEPLPWWQMIARHTMPRMSPKTRGMKIGSEDYVERPDFVIPGYRPCPECGRDGRSGTLDRPLEIVYSRSAIDPRDTPDVTETWECFGRSVKSPPPGQSVRYASPSLLVKPKVLDVFRRLKAKEATFAPVFFE